MKKHKIIIIGILGLFLGIFFLLKLSFYPPIFLYDTNSFNQQLFLSQLKFIRERGFKIVSLEEFSSSFKKGKVNKILSIVFLGSKNILALSQLAQKENIPLVVFIDKESVENNRKSLSYELGEPLLEIGLLSKKNLGELSTFQIQKEISLYKRFIEEFLDKKVKYIAFNLGKPKKEILKAIESNGYLCGLSLDKSLGGSVFSLRPIRVSFTDTEEVLKKKLSGFYYLFKRK